jgi:hypothetical protein
MKTLNMVMLTMGVLMVYFSSVSLFTDCKAASAPPDKAAAVVAEAAYGAELIACEQDAGTRAQGAACRCGVDARFGVEGDNCK